MKGATTKVGELMSTMDYGLFKMIDGNRRLNPTNYTKLINSMKEEQLIIPIIVNELGEIVDGQHRYTASKSLGLPIYYIVVNGYGLNQVKRANQVSVNWKKEDYLEMFLSSGCWHYEKLSELMNRYDISLNNMLKIFSKAQNKQMPQTESEFFEGDFKSDNIQEVVKFLGHLEEFNSFSDYKSKSFITAFITLYFKAGYKQDIMTERLHKHITKLEKKNSSDDYLVVLCNNIYSYGRSLSPIYYSKESKKFH